MPTSLDIIDKIKQGLSSVESQGKYDALGKVTSSGDRAYGKYQIMGNNIPSWTKEATGTSYSKEDFLKNPDLQEKVTSHKVLQYYNKYKNPEDVVSTWFTGGPVKTSGNKKDINGTTTPQYIRGVMKGMGSSGDNISTSNNDNGSLLGMLTGAKTAYASTGDNQDNSQSTKMSIEQFGQKIQSKHPEYGDMSAIDVGQKVLSKYPQYQDMIDNQPQNQSTQFTTQPSQSDSNGYVTSANLPQQSDQPIQNSGLLGTNPNDSMYGKLIDNSITRGIRNVGSALTFGGSEQLGKATGKDIYAATSGDLSDVPNPGEMVSGGAKTLAGTALLASGGLLGEAVNPLTDASILERLPANMTTKAFLSLNKTEQLNVLGDMLNTANKTGMLGDVGKIAKAIKSLEPSQGFITTLIKNSYKLGKGALFTKLFGDYVGNIIHQSTNK